MRRTAAGCDIDGCRGRRATVRAVAVAVHGDGKVWRDITRGGTSAKHSHRGAEVPRGVAAGRARWRAAGSREGSCDGQPLRVSDCR